MSGRRAAAKVPKSIKIRDPVFDTYIELLICPTQQLNDFLKYWGVDDYEARAETQGRLIKVRPGDSARAPHSNTNIIWLRRKHIPSLAHELLHHLVLTFEEKHIPMNWDNTETMSYYLGFLIDEALKLWRK